MRHKLIQRSIKLFPMAAEGRGPIHASWCSCRRMRLPHRGAISVNTPFWKIRVTRVQQKIFHREFSVPAKYFEPVGRCGWRLRAKHAIDYKPKLY